MARGQCTKQILVGEVAGTGGTNASVWAKRSSRPRFLPARDSGRAAIRSHVLEDRSQPRTTIRARRKPMKGLQGLRQRFLDEIFSFGPIPFEPHRETEQPVDVWQGLCFEGFPRRFVRHGQSLVVRIPGSVIVIPVGTFAASTCSGCEPVWRSQDPAFSISSVNRHASCLSLHK